MTDLGPYYFYLGLRITRNRRRRAIYLDQHGYIEKILQQFDIEYCTPADTPMTGSKLEKPGTEYTCSNAARTSYQSAVGSLIYLMLGTRPDIAYAISVLSRYCNNPDHTYEAGVKRVMRYLKGSKEYTLVYEGNITLLSGYTDADWGGDPDTRRSTSGYVFNIGSAAISWSSKRQPTTALSSCEAEYMGQTQATKEAIWLQRLFTELSTVPRGDGNAKAQQGPQAVIIYSDNQGAIALAKNPTNH
jgi:hypothetical protein